MNFERSRGMTLAELLVASVIAAVIGLAAITLIKVAANAYLHFGARAQGSRETTRGLDLLHEDIMNSYSLKQGAPGKVDFTLARWNAVGATESIRYRWSGTAGDPFERATNGTDTVIVLDKVETFDARWLWTTKTAYGLENESVALVVEDDMPVYIFDEYRKNYTGALATSAGADSAPGVATIATSGYALATRGGTGGPYETGPFAGGDVWLSWEAPDTITEITDVSLFMKLASTTGSFLDTGIDLLGWSENANWTTGDYPGDGNATSVIYPTALRILHSDPLNVLWRLGSERFRAWILTFNLWADQFVATLLLDDTLTADFSHWVESPVPGAGFFLRANPAEDAPMDMAIVTSTLDTAIRFLLLSDTRSLLLGDYKATFDLWMPKISDTRPLPDSRAAAAMHSYSTDFQGGANQIPDSWQKGTWSDFLTKSAGAGEKALFNDTSGGHATWNFYADTAFWSDTMEIAFDLYCEAITETMYLVVASPDSLYSNRLKGESPKGAVVVGIKYIDEPGLGQDRLQLQAYSGNGAAASLIKAGAPMDIDVWTPGVTKNRMRFVFHNGTLSIYNSEFHPTNPQFLRTGFATAMPTWFNYYGLLHARGGPVDAWQIDNFQAAVTRTPPGIGGLRGNGVVFSDDFEDGGNLPSAAGWYTEMTTSGYFRIGNVGGSKHLKYEGGDVNTYKPLYFNHPAWNSARPETFAFELDIRRTNAVSGQANIILATPGFYPGDSSASRYTSGVRMVRLQAIAGEKLQITAAWGTGTARSLSTTFDAVHENNTTRRFRFEMDGRTLKVYREGVLVKTWTDVFPSHILSYTAGFDGMDNTKTVSYDQISVYHGGYGGLPTLSTYLVSRFSDASTYYRIRLYQEATGRSVMAQTEEVIAGAVTVIDAPVLVADLDSIARMTLTVDGFDMTFEGPLGTLSARHLAGLSRGTFGFGSGLRHAHYDNIRIETINGEADFIARSASPDSQIIIRFAPKTSTVDVRIIRKTPAREIILSEIRQVMDTRDNTPVQIRILPTDDLVLLADTGAGLRQILAMPINNDIPAGALGFSQGTARILFDDIDCTTTATFSPHVIVQLIRDNTTSVAYSTALKVSDLSDTFEEVVFSFSDKVLDPTKIYRFRVFGATVPENWDGSTGDIDPGGEVTADIQTFLPVNYSGSTALLDENNATYGITGASNPWQLRYGAYDGILVPQSNATFYLWDDVLLPVNGRIVRQDRVTGGLMYDIEVKYGEERIRYAGGATSAYAR